MKLNFGKIFFINKINFSLLKNIFFLVMNSVLFICQKAQIQIFHNSFLTKQ